MAEEFISFDQAVKILHEELKYPQDKALYFVKTFDKNNDGRLCSNEFKAFRNKIEEAKVTIVPKFKEYDRDNNGYITLEEASSILQKPPFHFPADRVLMLLRRFDKDGNGKLDIEEFAGFYAEAKATNDEVAEYFSKLDKDGNGVLSPDEIVCAIKEKMGFDEVTAKHMVQMFDTNKDGSLDKTEFMNLWTSMFGKST